jgi:C_GCAxxG_C_C family probable redox protein
MDAGEFVEKRVKKYYREDDFNCAVTTLKILSEYFNIEINRQVIDSAEGLGGGLGFYGAQCGLANGAVMFFGLYGRQNNLTDDQIAEISNNFASNFESKFGSLLCRKLRPEGFKDDNPPDLCEKITIDAIIYDLEFFSNQLESVK